MKYFFHYLLTEFSITYGARTNDLGNKEHGEIIAEAASQALAQLESGSVEVAQAILQNLVTWGVK